MWTCRTQSISLPLSTSKNRILALRPNYITTGFYQPCNDLCNKNSMKMEKRCFVHATWPDATLKQPVSSMKHDGLCMIAILLRCFFRRVAMDLISVSLSLNCSTLHAFLAQVSSFLEHAPSSAASCSCISVQTLPRLINSGWQLTMLCVVGGIDSMSSYCKNQHITQRW